MYYSNHNSIAPPNAQLSHFTSLLGCALTTGRGGPEVTSNSDQLLLMISSHSSDDSLSFPGLDIQKSSKLRQLRHKLSLDEVAKAALTYSIVCGVNHLSNVPLQILGNFSASFMSLVDSRVRHTSMEMIKQHRRSPGVSQLQMLLRLMAHDPIAVKTVVTSFQPVPLDQSLENYSPDYTVVPLVFEVVMDLLIFGDMETITIRCPGTMTASMTHPLNRIRSCDLNLDMSELLSTMMKNARYIVRQSVAKANAIVETVQAQTSSSKNFSKNSFPSLASLGNSFLDSSNMSFSSLTKNDSSLMLPPPPRKPVPITTANSLCTKKRKLDQVHRVEDDSCCDGNQTRKSVSSIFTLKRPINGNETNTTQEVSYEQQEALKRRKVNSHSCPNLI